MDEHGGTMNGRSTAVEHGGGHEDGVRRLGRRLVPALVYAALTASVVSSLGMLLVPSVAHDFAVPVSTAQWMLTVNLLVGSVATPVMGRLADGPRPRRLLLVSLAVILSGSLLAALAPVFWLFLVGRALQGLAYGIVPVTIALARRHLSALQSRPAISTLSVTVATGLGLGYPLTGVLAAVLDYRAAFAFAVLFLVTALAGVLWGIPADAPAARPAPPFDVPGTVLLTLGLGALLLCLSEGSRWGWLSAPGLVSAAVAVLGLALWIRTELRRAHPLVNLRVFRSGDVLLANGTAIGLGTAVYISMSIVSLVIQAPASTGYGQAVPVLWAGFLFLPLSVGSMGANRVVRRLVSRVDIAVFLPVGALVMTAAAVLHWAAHTHLVALALGMFLIGVGIGSGYAAMPALIARRVVVEELGSAVSFNQVLRTVGGSFGAAGTAAVLAAHPSGGPYSTDAGISTSLVLGIACGVVVLVPLLVHALRGRRAVAY